MSAPLLANVSYTSVAFTGLNGAGLISLADGDVLGPFAPQAGDKVVTIFEGLETHRADDATGFGSTVEEGGKLRQYDTGDLSYATLIVVLSRTVVAAEADDDPVISPSYFAKFTTLGLQRLAEAQYSGTPLVFTHVAVGDGGGLPITPSASMTALVNETARVPVNNVEISPDAPTVVRVEGLLPAEMGGFMLREAGLFNHAGELLAVASYPPLYKPLPAEGVSVEGYIRVLLEYAQVEAVALTTDPDVVTATRLYVDDRTAGGLKLWEDFT